ncbi:phosphoglycerol transferase MdoB-like AlkP superfamily enzyme [Fontibacillus phaseoli]|uniref:Phosphoglycerol transferase MdoB-like AlkP superfamily enzyme n=1 Tax=Fontibacillus phaseoli TaxID=1416533 RepID=A0A369BEW8_9BACL|nr:LTA synthase family protein [Fontibacillus phaseoli]RCX18224.1 phosphoglycerol transferase MdoB-like AlkP superfamily enzyme [Fontibacillus phaseoli]
MRSQLSSNQGKFIFIFMLLLLKIGLMRFFFYEGIHLQGLLSEAISMLAILCLVDLIFPVKRKGPVYWSFNFIYSFMLFAATLYYAHFGTVPTYAVLSELNQVPQIRASVNALIRPEQFLFFSDFVLLAANGIIHMIRQRRRSRSLSFRTSTRSPVRSGFGWKVGMVSVLIIGVVVSGLIVRSGKKIDNELVRAEKIGFVNFQADAALRNREEERMIAEGNIQETIAKVENLQAGYPYRGTAGDDNGSKGNSPKYFGAARGMNLIVIQMESFQNFPINLKLEGQEVTPVLNSLAKSGVYFPHIFQQIGPGNTSDAEFMSNTSIYPTAAVAMSKGYGSREIPSLPRLLQQHGYVANTFHINTVTFWDRNKLYPALNFDKYYDKPSFKNDHFNDFGASDEEMYRVGIERLTELESEGQPFYAQFVTTSSHSPFVVPEDKVQIQLPEDLKGTNLGNYITAVNYTDYAIGKLIEQLKEAGMWDNTMLAIYGDHFGIQPSETGADEIREKLGIAYDDQISRFNIPFLLHIPGQELGLVPKVTGGQVDMMPTMANLLGVSLKEDKFTAFGQDLLNIDRNVAGMRYYLPTGSFFNNEVMFVPGQGFDDGKAISLETLEPVPDISGYRSDYEYVTQLMKLSDEYVKLLPKRH